MLFHQNEHEDKDLHIYVGLGCVALNASTWFVKAGNVFSYLQNPVAVHGRHKREESPETGETWTLVMLCRLREHCFRNKNIEQTFLISEKNSYLQQ